jgi:phosphatidate phosphatase APP1
VQTQEDRKVLDSLRVLPAATLAVLLIASAPPAACAQEVSDINDDERVLFFSTVARLDDDGAAWNVPIHGWIFEPETDDALRGAALREFRDRLGLDPADASTRIFEERMRLFLVDNEGGKRIVVRIAGQQQALELSARGGHFTGIIEVPADAAAAQLVNGGRFTYVAVTEAPKERRFEGVSYGLLPEGISVISDIDDTIKVSEVLDKRELIRNTFLREFRAVEGMAAAYSRWAEQGAAFHYVSASPWQLYEPLSTFTREAGFPGGSFHLKQFRVKDSSFLSLLENPITYKLAVIEPLLAQFPKRRFILVGDSGEKDPEVYGILARRRPEQILRVYIRDVTGEPADGARYQEAFRELPPEKWRLFQEPSALEWRGESERWRGESER